MSNITKIYNDGTYIKNNKTLHSEDSEYKFLYIKQLLDSIDLKRGSIKILDVGGGAGLIGKMVCEYYINKNIQIEFYALDLSSDMLEIQKQNNPYIVKTLNIDILELDCDNFDLVLMIDVIEHIPKYKKIAQKLSNISEFVVYNIPIEINLFDKLRNIYFKGQYYKWQIQTLGHIHFFSYFSALKFMREYYKPIKWLYSDYSSHVLTTKSEEYEKQRANRLRNLELKISRFIYRYFKFIAPFIIQGSLFIVAKKNDKKSDR